MCIPNTADKMTILKNNYYHAIFEFSQDAIFVEDFEGQIVDVNSAACNLLQYTREELLTMNVSALLPPDEQQSGKELLHQELIAEGRSFVGHNIRKDGHCISVEVRVNDFWQDDKPYLIAAVRDITKRLQAEEKIQEQNQFFFAMDQVSIGLLSRLDRDDILRNVLTHAGQLFHTPDACIALLSNDHKNLEQKLGIGRYADCFISFKPGEGLIGKVWQNGEPLVIENYKSWSGRLQHPLADMAQMCVAIPLKSNGNIIGVIGMDFYDQSRPFSKEDMEMLGQFAQVASIALVNAELYTALAKSEKALQEKNIHLTAAYEELLATEEELRNQFTELMAHEEKISRQNTILASVHETALGLLNGLDFDTVLAKIISSAAELVGTEHAWMYVLDKENEKFVDKMGLGIFSQDINERAKVMESLVEVGYKTGEIVVLDDYSSWEKEHSALFDTVHSVAQVPLKEKDNIIGFFTLAFVVQERKFADEEITLLSRFAELAAIALANARLYKNLSISEKQLQQKNEEFSATHDELIASENELRQQFYALLSKEEEIRCLSLYDSMTGVYNRSYFEEALKRIEGAQEICTSLIISDLDGLKIINDTLGHKAGDVALKAFAKILKDYFKKDELVARIGGDEFAVILHTSAEARVKKDCRNIRKQVERYNMENPKIPISVSMGFAVGCKTPIDMKAIFDEADNNMYREKLHRSQSSRSAIVQALITALEARDFQTEGHSDRLQHLMEDLAIAMNFPEQQLSDLRLFARFHDIGKVGIPDHILFKPGKLTDEEYAIMRQHSDIGHRIALSATDLVPIADWILKHHERWDGSGYPLGLYKDEIPLVCRMLGIIDAYDAMISDRPYRKAMSQREAIAELKMCAGTQFDPNLVDIFTVLLHGDYQGKMNI